MHWHPTCIDIFKCISKLLKKININLESFAKNICINIVNPEITESEESSTEEPKYKTYAIQLH